MLLRIAGTDSLIILFSLLRIRKHNNKCIKYLTKVLNQQSTWRVGQLELDDLTKLSPNYCSLQGLEIQEKKSK